MRVLSLSGYGDVMSLFVVGCLLAAALLPAVRVGRVYGQRDIAGGGRGGARRRRGIFVEKLIFFFIKKSLRIWNSPLFFDFFCTARTASTRYVRSLES